MTDLAQVRIDNGIGELILNRPKQRNSLIGPLVWELQTGLETLEKDDSCKVIMIRGAGGYFCAGLDLKALSEVPEPAWRARFGDDWAKFHRTIFNANKPIIGALESYAIAGGSALAFACDFLVVGEGAFIHVAEVERGMMAPVNIVWLKIRHNYNLALKMAVLGERHYGASLVQLGIADRCVNDDSVLDTARSMAERIAGFDSANVRELKRVLRTVSQSHDFDQLLDEVRQA